MKILTILGSPRKGGNTAAILKAFEEKVSINYEIERINIIDKNIKGCYGCDACQKNVNEPSCMQQDDFNEIVGKIIASDIIVYAAPVYVWDFPSQMKALMDRHYCLTKWKGKISKYLIENKHTVLLTTCSGNAENNTDLLQLIFNREMEYLHCHILGRYIVPLCTIPSKLGNKKKIIVEQMVQEIIRK